MEAKKQLKELIKAVMIMRKMQKKINSFIARFTHEQIQLDLAKKELVLKEKLVDKLITEYFDNEVQSLFCDTTDDSFEK